MFFGAARQILHKNSGGIVSSRLPNLSDSESRIAARSGSKTGGKYSAAWVGKDFKNSYELVQDEDGLRLFVKARLLRLSVAVDTSAAVRCLELLLNWPADGSGKEGVDDDEHTSIESISKRYLEARGFSVTRVDDDGAV